jgi:hypothetical protein
MREMNCCGETSAGRLTISQKDIDNGLALQIEYLGGRTIHVKGSTSGKIYIFSELQGVQDVDPRDAVAILRERVFRVRGVTRGRS